MSPHTDTIQSHPSKPSGPSVQGSATTPRPAAHAVPDGPLGRLESEREFYERNVESIYTDRSPEAEAVRSLPYAFWASGERAAAIDAYRPPRRLLSLARRRPGIAGLCCLPADERAFYGLPAHQTLNRELFPEVSETEWLIVFPQT